MLLLILIKIVINGKQENPATRSQVQFARSVLRKAEQCEVAKPKAKIEYNPLTR